MYHALANPCRRMIHRTDKLKIIQYRPTTTEMHAIPVLIIPSPVIRFYRCDLQGKNSLVYYLVKQAFRGYTLKCRNPIHDHRYWRAISPHAKHLKRGPHPGTMFSNDIYAAVLTKIYSLPPFATS